MRNHPSAPLASRCSHVYLKTTEMIFILEKGFIEKALFLDTAFLSYPSPRVESVEVRAEGRSSEKDFIAVLIHDNVTSRCLASSVSTRSWLGMVGGGEGMKSAC